MFELLVFEHKIIIYKFFDDRFFSHQENTLRDLGPILHFFKLLFNDTSLERVQNVK